MNTGLKATGVELDGCFCRRKELYIFYQSAFNWPLLEIIGAIKITEFLLSNQVKNLVVQVKNTTTVVIVCGTS